MLYSETAVSINTFIPILLPLFDKFSKQARIRPVTNWAYTKRMARKNEQ